MPVPAESRPSGGAQYPHGSFSALCRESRFERQRELATIPPTQQPDSRDALRLPGNDPLLGLWLKAPASPDSAANTTRPLRSRSFEPNPRRLLLRALREDYALAMQGAFGGEVLRDVGGDILGRRQGQRVFGRAWP